MEDNIAVELVRVSIVVPPTAVLIGPFYLDETVLTLYCPTLEVFLKEITHLIIILNLFVCLFICLFVCLFVCLSGNSYQVIGPKGLKFHGLMGVTWGGYK